MERAPWDGTRGDYRAQKGACKREQIVVIKLYMLHGVVYDTEIAG